MTQQQFLDSLVSAIQAAHELNLSTGTVKNYIKSSRLTGKRLGRGGWVVIKDSKFDEVQAESKRQAE